MPYKAIRLIRDKEKRDGLFLTFRYQYHYISTITTHISVSVMKTVHFLKILSFPLMFDVSASSYLVLHSCGMKLYVASSPKTRIDGTT